MDNLNFTALDFETATPDHNSICQIGLVVVNYGFIERKLSFLVQPPENKYAYHNILVHQITPVMTENSPKFNELWDDISKYLENQHLVCHNASFDLIKLQSTLSFYNIPNPDYTYSCTLELFGGKLEECCEEQNIEFTNHHDALSDAEASAKLYLKFLENSGELIIAKTKVNYFAQKKVDKNDLKPNFNIENKDNPFFMKKVVFTGDLMNFTRKEVAHKIKTMGADVNTSISKKTDFVIIGRNPGPSKMIKIKELGIPIITEEDFIKMLE